VINIDREKRGSELRVVERTTDEEKRSHLKPDRGISTMTCYDNIYCHGNRDFEVPEAMKMGSVSNTPENEPTEGSKHVAVQHHKHIKDKC
jgi:hypothetical protein